MALSTITLVKKGYLIAEHNEKNISYYLKYAEAKIVSRQKYRCYEYNHSARKKLRVMTIGEIAELNQEGKLNLIENKIKLNIKIIPPRLKVRVIVLPTFD